MGINFSFQYSELYYLAPEFELGPGEALGLVSCRRIEVCLDGGRGSGFKPLLICSRC